MHLYPYLFIPPGTPAVFVADPHSVDIGKPIGVWLNLEWPPDILRGLVEESGLHPDRVIVIDQINAGPLMLDETTPLAALDFLVHRWAVV